MPFSYNPLLGVGLDKSIPLDGAGKIPSTFLPSYVDDVEEYNNLAAFPATGETGKIYVAIDTGFVYRWSGSVYVQIGITAAAGATTQVQFNDAGAFGGDAGLTYDKSTDALTSGSLSVTSAGAAATPSLTFTGDPNTGIFSPGADQLAISTGGTARLTSSTTALTSALPVDVPLGAAATPSLTFTGDLNTGIYSPGADQLAVATNGTRRLDVNSSGQFRIGDGGAVGIFSAQAAANGNLHIRDIAAVTGSGTGVALDVLNDATSAVQDLAIRGTNTIFRNSAGETLRITSAGLVGIGTSAPSELLDIDADGDSYLRWERDGASGSYSTSGGVLRIGPYFSATARELALYSDNSGDSWVTTGTAQNLYLGTNKTARLTITSTGLVGIGTTGPSATLELSGAGTVFKANTATTTSTAISLQLGGLVTSSNSGCFIKSHVNLGSTLNSQLSFEVNGGALEAARIDSSGRLLVGTSTSRSTSSIGWIAQIEGLGFTGLGITSNVNSVYGPYLSLTKSRGGAVGSNTIVQTGDELGGILFSGTDGSTANSIAASISCAVEGTPLVGSVASRLVFFTTADGAASPTERMRIDNAGRVLVGTSTANTSGAKLQTSDGLTFPATAVASADPNTLDDYEEGTWTPTVVGTSTAGTASYTVQVGSYTKIGQQVTAQVNVVYSAGTGTGNLNISGLPFTCANVTNRFFVGSSVFESITTTALNQAYCGVSANTSSISFAQFPLGGGSATNISYDAAGQILATITYFA